MAEISEATLKRLRNLKFYKDMTDEEIAQHLSTRPEKPEEPEEEPTTTEESSDDESYTKQFKAKLRKLQAEYTVDMNDVNDADSLRSLVRLSIQLEVIDNRIREFYTSKSTNTKALKDLGDYQRSLQMSISDLQKQLGISREARKEKTVDDIPKYIAGLQDKALNLWNRKTAPIKCPNDEIELARVWINFPKLKRSGALEFECWKCHTMVVFNV